MSGLTFKGYKRPDGRVGVRNYVLILPTSVCSSDVTRFISSQVPGTVTFDNQYGCAQVGRELEFTMKILEGYAANPNIFRNG